MRQMNIAEDFQHADTAAFVEALKKYLKIIKICNNDTLDGCLGPQINGRGGVEAMLAKDIKRSNNLNENDWDTDTVGIVLQNGHSAILAYNPNCEVKGIAASADELMMCVSAVYDLNGKANPNVVGLDMKTLNASALNVTPAGPCDRLVKVGGLTTCEGELYAGSDFNLDTTLTANRSWDTTCTSKTSYWTDGTSTCYHCLQNRWAGAKKYCDALGLRLPTRAELKTLDNAGGLITGSGVQGRYWSSERDTSSFVGAYIYDPGTNTSASCGKCGGAKLKCVK